MFMYFLTLNNISMGTKALSFKDKDIQRAEAQWGKINFG